MEPTLLPPSTHGVPVLPGKLSFVAYQFDPLLTSLIALYCWVSVHDVIPSIVCDDVVAIVSVEPFELEFFTQYSRPDIPTAVGSVSVAAEVPVNTSRLSDPPAVVFPVNVVTGVANAPLTSRVECGLVVPTPICACDLKADNKSVAINNFFIDWFFNFIGSVYKTGPGFIFQSILFV